MRLDLDAGRSLDQGLLRLYRQALAERRWEVAEHLLSALGLLGVRKAQVDAVVNRLRLRRSRAKCSRKAGQNHDL